VLPQVLSRFYVAMSFFISMVTPCNGLDGAPLAFACPGRVLLEVKFTL